MFGVYRIQGCEARSPPDRGHPSRSMGVMPRWRAPERAFLGPAADQPSAVLGRVKRWVLAVLAMLARKGGLRVAPCGCAPAAKGRRFGRALRAALF